MENTPAKKTPWLEKPFLANLTVTPWMLAFGLILILGVVSRLYDLGTRMMSHDEINHVYFAWTFFRGGDYIHHPLSHGPLQFHLLSFAYFLFNDSDFSARLPSAIFSIATIALMWKFRRYLGKEGAVTAAAFFVISPFMLYYGRYARNEAIAIFFTIATVWIALRYLESGQNRYLYFLAAAMSLHFATKETAFIFTAQLLVFLGLLFVYRMAQRTWQQPGMRAAFLLLLANVILLLGWAASVNQFYQQPIAENPVISEEGGAPVVEAPAIEVPALDAPAGEMPAEETPETVRYLIIGAGASFLAALILLITGYGWSNLTNERTFSLMFLQLTFVIPQLSGFLLFWRDIKWDHYGSPEDAIEIAGIVIPNATIQIAEVVVPMVLISIFAGLLWKSRQWLISAGIYYLIFAVFHTSIFTNITGLYTGLVGSLAYWLEQQAVERGSQPWYYYIVVQIPIYEYLAALGTILTSFVGGRWLVRQLKNQTPINLVEDGETGELPLLASRVITVALLLFWSLTAVGAYMVAGEKMPWLTAHITWPMWMAAAWLVGRVIKRIDWPHFRQNNGLFVVALIGFISASLVALIEFISASLVALIEFINSNLGAVFWKLAAVDSIVIAVEIMLSTISKITWPMWIPVAALASWVIWRVDWPRFWQKNRPFLLAVFIFTGLSLAAAIFAWSGPVKPFSGSSLPGLENTSSFVIAAVVLGISLYLGLRLLKEWSFGQVSRVIALTFFSLLALLTARTSILATFINYDYANEYLVYAHAAHGPQEIFEQVEEISYRVTGGKNLKVAFDNHSQYPFWWYLRDYPNQLNYGENPTRELRDFPVILVGDANYGKVEPIVGQAYVAFEYQRMVWPNQDYYNLDIFKTYLDDPELRGDMLYALWQIWLNRNFDPYAQLTGNGLSIENWTPSNSMKMYVRKDIAAQIWDYGLSLGETELTADPYDEKLLEMSAALTLGELGLNGPKDIAIAPNGTLYLADTGNNRILHLTVEGSVIDQWGSEGGGDGQFLQPWGLTVDPAGNVYVADTWNHKIQKFSPSGEFILSWGELGQSGDPYHLYGPRDVVIDQDGNVLVSDTGNKRILVFDPQGNFIRQFGQPGSLLGQFEEPVGLAVSPVSGDLFVADTWNQRIQVFEKSELGSYFAFTSWDFIGWYGQSLENKPQIAAGLNDRLYVTDPEYGRVVIFSGQGELLGAFGTLGDLNNFGLVSSLAADDFGGLWVVDSQRNQLHYFILPPLQ